MLLLARTTPLEEVKKPTEGLSLFYTALDRKYVEARVIDKMGRKAVDSNQLFFDGLPVPLEDRIGEEGKGFEYILHGMNPERILIAAEAVGIGRAALARAARYAKERIVFGRPIGQNQAIQHPLAKCWAELEAANLMMLKAARLYDAGKPCGVEANAAKYLAAEAGFTACETAVMTHGGMGYAKEFHVERYLREVLIARIAPVSRELILSPHRREGARPAQVVLIDAGDAPGAAHRTARRACGRRNASWPSARASGLLRCRLLSRSEPDCSMDGAVAPRRGGAGACTITRR